jgi:hypothetical protein
MLESAYGLNILETSTECSKSAKQSSNSSILWDSDVLGCDAMLFGTWFLKYCWNVMASPTAVQALKMKAL